LELIISFLIGFCMTWFLIKEDVVPQTTNLCPNKEAINQLAETYCGNKRLVKELKEYSLLKIQDGHYEYGDVLNTLKKKDVV